MNEERKMILEMVSRGEITVDEAERLISAVGENEDAMILPSLSNGVSPKRIVIVVDKDGKKMVNLRVPIAFIRPALKLGKAGMALSAKHGESDVDTEKIVALIDEIDMDEIMDSLNDGDITLPYTIIDVEDDENQHVMITLE